MDTVMIERFYPSSESFLIGVVDNKDLYGYLSHGFALVKINGEDMYVSYCYYKPTIEIPQTQEIAEIMRQKDESVSNQSCLRKLLVRLKGIQVHNGDNESAWDKVSKELAKEEYKETIENFRVTIGVSIGFMFPNYQGDI